METWKPKGLGPVVVCGEDWTRADRKVWRERRKKKKNPITESDFDVALEGIDGEEKREGVEEEFCGEIED